MSLPVDVAVSRLIARMRNAAPFASIGDGARQAIELRDDEHVASADKVESGVKRSARRHRRHLLGEDLLDASGAKVGLLRLVESVTAHMSKP
jgi:hypothetical protein